MAPGPCARRRVPSSFVGSSETDELAAFDQGASTTLIPRRLADPIVSPLQLLSSLRGSVFVSTSTSVNNRAIILCHGLSSSFSDMLATRCTALCVSKRSHDINYCWRVIGVCKTTWRCRWYSKTWLVRGPNKGFQSESTSTPENCIFLHATKTWSTWVGKRKIGDGYG